eukprot:NODE_9_length_64580_cov_1.431941.p23 type:complete len:332 gc:universal NODE_9_length_64580_cov_1.431941:26304-27299(+)
MSKVSNDSRNSPLQDLILIQAGQAPIDNNILSLKNQFTEYENLTQPSMTNLSNRKIRVIRKNDNAKVCLVKNEGANALFSNLVNKVPEDMEVMQIEQHPVLPDKLLLPTGKEPRLERTVENMYSSFGSHLPNRDTTNAVLGERESALLRRKRNFQRKRMKELTIYRDIDLNSLVLQHISKAHNSEMSERFQNNPDSQEAIEEKLNFLILWINEIKRLKLDRNSKNSTQILLEALYKQQLVEHIKICSTKGQTSKYMYRHENESIQAMMNRIIIRSPQYQGSLPPDKPFAHTSGLVDETPKLANSAPEYTPNCSDIENYHILKKLASIPNTT